MNNITKIAVLTYLSLAPLPTLKSSSCVAEKSQEEQDYQSDLEKAHQFAQQTGNDYIIKKLLSSKKSIKKMDFDKDDQSLLILASLQNHPSVINFLLSAKADVNRRGRSGETALMAAACQQSTKATELLSYALLLAAGADPFLKDKYGDTAFSRAQKTGHGQKAYKLEVIHLVHIFINPHQDANIAKIIEGYVGLQE